MTDHVAELYRLSALVRLRHKRSAQLYQLLCRLSARLVEAGGRAASPADTDGYCLTVTGMRDGGSFCVSVCKADDPDCPPVTDLGALCARAEHAWRRAALRYTAAHKAFKTVGENFLAGMLGKEHRWVGSGEYGSSTHGQMCGDCGADVNDDDAKEPCVPLGDDALKGRPMAEVKVAEAKFDVRMTLTANQIRQLKSCMSHSYGDQEYFVIQEVKVIFERAVCESAARNEGL